MKRLIFDLDDTICTTNDGDYPNSIPDLDFIAKMREYKLMGFEIIISTSRNMRTFNGNLGLINARTLPVVLDWLSRHDIPHDEVYVGKPWCGREGFYIDDRSIRPDEFLSLSYEEIKSLLKIVP